MPGLRLRPRGWPALDTRARGAGARAVGLATSARGGVRGARWVILSDRPWLAGARWRRGDGRASGLSTFACPRRRPLAPERGVLHHERLRQRDTARHVRRRGASKFQVPSLKFKVKCFGLELGTLNLELG